MRVTITAVLRTACCLLMVLVLAEPTWGKAEASADLQAQDATTAAVLAQASWVATAKRCPVDVAPPTKGPDTPAARRCEQDGTACLASCKQGDGWSCYWLALSMGARGALPMASETLYQQACQHGVASGCTNRAAGLLAQSPQVAQVQACAAKTFAMTCERKDPWGCVMHALHLSKGMGTAKNVPLARRVLKEACRFGPDDEACIRAGKMRASMQGR